LPVNGGISEKKKPVTIPTLDFRRIIPKRPGPVMGYVNSFVRHLIDSSFGFVEYPVEKLEDCSHWGNFSLEEAQPETFRKRRDIKLLTFGPSVFLLS